MNELTKCVSDLKMYMGLPPFDVDSNFVKLDQWYKNQIEQTYSQDVLIKARAEVRKLNIKWQNIRKKFINETKNEYDDDENTDLQGSENLKEAS